MISYLDRKRMRSVLGECNDRSQILHPDSNQVLGGTRDAGDIK